MGEAWTPDLQIPSSKKEAYGCTNEAPGGWNFLIRHSELVKYPATFSIFPPSSKISGNTADKK